MSDEDKKIRRVSRGRKLTPEEAAKYRQVRDQVEQDKPAIAARIRRRLEQDRELAQVFSELKRVRESQGLSLTDVQEKTGIDRSTLSKLETGVRANYTLDTIMRYADAVGKRVLIALADSSPGQAK